MMVDNTGMRTDQIEIPITSETSDSNNTNDGTSGTIKNNSTTVVKPNR